jgi:hypothetical protein
MGNDQMQHAFSVEMRSRAYVRHISLSNGSRDHVLFEGYLGGLIEVSMVEGSVLEVKGEHGVLRIDLPEAILQKMLAKKKEGP